MNFDLGRVKTLGLLNIMTILLMEKDKIQVIN